MAEVLEEYCMYKDILKLIKSIYGIVQAEHFWFKEQIKTTTLKAGLKQFNNDTCLLYRLNELRTVIVIVYVDNTLEIGEKTALMNKIKRVKKEYAT